MSQLFTVRIYAKRIVVGYGSDGKEVTSRVEEIAQTYSDLPFVTAKAYRTQFPDNRVEITEQVPEFSAARQPAKTSHGKVMGNGRIGSHRPAAQVDDYDAAEQNDFTSAAISGDMAAAINAELDA